MKHLGSGMYSLPLNHRIPIVKSEHHLLEELLLGDCSWHFDSQSCSIFQSLGCCAERNFRIERAPWWKILACEQYHKNDMLYQLESIAGSYESYIMAAKDIDIHAIRVESHFLF